MQRFKAKRHKISTSIRFFQSRDEYKHPLTQQKHSKYSKKVCETTLTTSAAETSTSSYTRTPPKSRIKSWKKSFSMTSLTFSLPQTAEIWIKWPTSSNTFARLARVFSSTNKTTSLPRRENSLFLQDCIQKINGRHSKTSMIVQLSLPSRCSRRQFWRLNPKMRKNFLLESSKCFFATQASTASTPPSLMTISSMSSWTMTLFRS